MSDQVMPMLSKVHDVFVPEGGLTKRELFSAMAMHGLVSIAYNKDSYCKDLSDTAMDELIAKAAVRRADALIKALE